MNGTPVHVYGCSTIGGAAPSSFSRVGPSKDPTENGNELSEGLEASSQQADVTPEVREGWKCYIEYWSKGGLVGKDFNFDLLKEIMSEIREKSSSEGARVTENSTERGDPTYGTSGHAASSSKKEDFPTDTISAQSSGGAPEKTENAHTHGDEGISSSTGEGAESSSSTSTQQASGNSDVTQKQGSTPVPDVTHRSSNGRDSADAASLAKRSPSPYLTEDRSVGATPTQLSAAPDGSADLASVAAEVGETPSGAPSAQMSSVTASLHSSGQECTRGGGILPQI